jgi:hypothetical protein
MQSDKKNFYFYAIFNRLTVLKPATKKHITAGIKAKTVV